MWCVNLNEAVSVLLKAFDYFKLFFLSEICVPEQNLGEFNGRYFVHAFGELVELNFQYFSLQVVAESLSFDIFKSDKFQVILFFQKITFENHQSLLWPCLSGQTSELAAWCQSDCWLRAKFKIKLFNTFISQ